MAISFSSSHNWSSHSASITAAFFLLVVGQAVHAGDWPMWRYNAERTATSPDQLPSNLQLRWTRQCTPREQTWDDPLNNDLMQFDKQFEPIVLGHRVIVGFNDSDKVVCWDLNTGDELWRFYTDGPVRLPPAGTSDRVFVTSDDGCIYCLDVSSGTLLWKHRGGPNSQKVLGNKRVISMWPARGGTVLRDGQVYYASSIWPFMGTFIYALDFDSGNVAWVNDHTAATYIKQPHSAPSFAGVAPQGSLAATEDYLLVPGGRSVPAAFDRETGELIHFHLNAGGKGNGGAFVMAFDDGYFVHTRERGVRKFDWKKGKKTTLQLNEPVLDGKLLVTSDSTNVRAIDSNADGTEQTVVWELPVDGGNDLIRAGDRIYAAGKDAITVIDVSKSQRAEVVEQLPASRVVRIVAGGDSLLAVTEDGAIQCYGAEETVEATEPKTFVTSPRERQQHADNYLRQFKSEHSAAFLAKQDATNGYAFIFDLQHESILNDILANSDLHVVAVTKNEELVSQLRRKYDELGLYGKRVAIHVGSPSEFRAPAYIARLVVLDDADELSAETLKVAFNSVRPYGGILALNSRDAESATSALREAKLANAKVSDGWPRDSANSKTSSRRGRTLIANLPYVQRVGALEGAAPWTHLYGDVGNTVKSNDRLVKAPLGLLWFGGNTHHDVLPRHSHAPGEQVVGGRLFVEGVNTLSARDVYTGRRLWKRDFQDLGTKQVYYDDTLANTPLSTKYNQVHIPGANARGTNFVATDEAVYLVKQDRCLVIDPRSGGTLRTLVLPKEVNPNGSATWTYVGVYEDKLIAGVDFAHGKEASALLKALSKATKHVSIGWSPKWFASRRVAILDSQSGELLWHRDAQHSFLHNGIVAGNGKVFLLDKLPQSVEDQASRRGNKKATDYRISAHDIETGHQAWDKSEDVFGTWLGYSAEHDTLVHAGAAAPDRSLDEAKAGLLALSGKTGTKLWENLGLKYSGPCILHNDWVIANSRSYSKTSGVVSILDGSPVTRKNPLTGAQEPWAYKRAYGCNTAVACENLLTFRSGAAGFYDLSTKCGVANLGGFRSGCTSNLIAADGVLNAPDFTRTCSCGYQNQTSLALVHMPDVEVWTVNPFELGEVATNVANVGINFGAAGTRRANDGTVWMEYPPVASEKFPIKVSVQGENVVYRRRHSSTQSGELSWVKASHLRNAQSITIDLGKQQANDCFDVRLYFSQPVADDAVAVQGKTAGKYSAHVQVFESVTLSSGKLKVDIRNRSEETQPQLAGIELRRVPQSATKVE